MLDKSLPYKNIIMKAPEPSPAARAAPPPGWHIQRYRPGDEQHWAAIETAVGEFESEAEALAHFREHYLATAASRARVEERCLFAVDERGRLGGTCTAWYEPAGAAVVSSLHWLAVRPALQQRGLGTALVSEVLAFYQAADAFPVYLHTQTWSHRAVLLYRRHGFRLVKTERLAHYGNDYAEALAVLQGVLSPAQYADLVDSAR